MKAGSVRVVQYGTQYIEYEPRTFVVDGGRRMLEGGMCTRKEERTLSGKRLQLEVEMLEVTSMMSRLRSLISPPVIHLFDHNSSQALQLQSHTTATYFNA